MRSTLFIFTFLTTSSVTSAIKCYSTDSNAPKTCDHTKFCSRITRLADGTADYLAGCGDELDHLHDYVEEAPRECQKPLNEELIHRTDGTLHLACCNKDLCNAVPGMMSDKSPEVKASSRVSSSLFSAAVVVSLAFLLY
ncbi:hypothetical protein L596_013225 [Steinernema carpocapsae]|uniref:Activin types I and II receptor domain-containing protein n=1 Tax=Steinernema carpocapsae TaxID=34508 RepID=A0A4U5NZH1_STECR|nr:hypothetical protein L596_013225 [Steinernema carpocapsae]